MYTNFYGWNNVFIVIISYFLIFILTLFLYSLSKKTNKENLGSNCCRNTEVVSRIAFIIISTPLLPMLWILYMMRTIDSRIMQFCGSNKSVTKLFEQYTVKFICLWTASLLPSISITGLILSFYINEGTSYKAFYWMTMILALIPFYAATPAFF
eukprot:UN03523